MLDVKHTLEKAYLISSGNYKYFRVAEMSSGKERIGLSEVRLKRDIKAE